jgi:eukaryotic-like serine/threonine-protein kinase
MATDWESEKEIFYDALELNVEARAVFLDEACAGNAEFRKEIERLLEYHAHARDFFLGLEQELGAADTQSPLFANAEVVAGRFEIRGFLARGGFAEVYEAFDRELAERVALKVLRGPWIARESIDRFKTEVRLARKIQSVHVCRVHDVGRVDRPGGVPVLFFSMELLEGETLSQYLRRRGPLAKAQALDLIRQIARGLQSAHELGVLHRDLKSANVMLVVEPSGSRKAVLTDFGLAVSCDSDEGCEYLAGTPAYMAPEQVERRPVSRSTDIYALGVIAFEMVTGHLPFPGETPMEQAEARLSAEPTPPTAFTYTLGRRWEKAILKCLARDPRKRFAHATEFVRALESPNSRRLSMVLPFAALLIATGIWAWTSLPHPPIYVASGSVVVIPFVVNGGVEQWQADALSDDLAAELAAVPGVRVVAQSTARQWAGKAKDAPELRRQLKVASVLSGSIGGAGGQMRVAIQLVDSGTGYLLWSRSYEGSPKDLPHMEETIVLASVAALQVRMPPLQVNTIRNRHSQVFAAYQAYSLGEYCVARRSTQGLQQAIASYRQAIAQDPNYALAYAGLAAAYNMIASRGVMRREEAFRLSDRALGQALALTPDLPEALLVKGSNRQLDSWDWDEAERAFRRCTQLAPGMSIGHQWLAGLLSLRARHAEALAEASQARDLDPLSPAANASYGTLLYRAHRYADAVAQLEWLVKREPAFLNAKLLLAEVYSQLGRHQEAIELAESVAAADGRASYALADLGHHYARGGRTDQAGRIAAELESRVAQGGARPSDVAAVYNGMADFEKTCEWLERGLPLHDAGLTVVKADPAYDAMRGFSRFSSLVDTLRL